MAPHMSSTETIYDDMLALQASMSFAFEAPFFYTPNWERAERVLDFGAGNGAYAAQLHDRFPGRSLTCVELNPIRAASARKRAVGRDMTVIEGSLDAAPGEQDFVLARLVLSHVPDRLAAVRQLTNLLRGQGSVLVIDALDDPLFFHPPLPKFRALLGQLRRAVDDRGGKRDTWADMRGLWESEGFRLVSSLQMVPNSVASGRYPMFEYMSLTAEFAAQGSLPSDVRDELVDWLRNSRSYAQYGVYGMLFERNTPTAGAF